MTCVSNWLLGVVVACNFHLHLRFQITHHSSFLYHLIHALYENLGELSLKDLPCRYIPALLTVIQEMYRV